MPARSTAYPRAGGVIVPKSLVRVGVPAEAGATGATTWLRRSLRHLPDQLLETPFPDPGTILAAWRLAARTQGALARIGETRDVWRLRDYAHRPRMGATAILDLLAAREENEHRHATRTPIAPVLAKGRLAPCFDLVDRTDELAAIFREHLPARPKDLADLLVKCGLTTRPPGVDDLARAFRARGLPVPFRVVRRLGGTVLVCSGSLASSEALLGAASELVFHWGVCTLDTVVERLRSLSAPAMTPKTAARLLSALPRFRWLDEPSNWFSFAGYMGRVGTAIRKIFSAVELVTLDDLARALGKRVKVLANAPRAAIEAYLVRIAGCEIRDGLVRAGTGFVPVALDRSERTIVEVLNRSGGQLATNHLRALAAGAGIKLAAIRHVVRSSPLVIAEAGHLRLTGLARGLASVVTEPGGPRTAGLAA